LANQLLQVKELNVAYGDIQAIWNVSIEVAEGSIVALVGANGSGKTTLLRTIAGLVKPKSGEVLFNENSLNRISPQKIVDRGLVLVPEGRRLFASLTVLENLKMGAYIPRSRKSYAESLERVFNLFPVLKTRSNQKAGSLSGGEQQMLAIGRAVMSQPRMLMLDEPSMGLSPLMVKHMFELIKVLHTQKSTILLVEQNVYQSLRIAERAYVLKNGKIVMSGTGAELLSDEDVCKAYIGEHGGKRQ
jgi:branched-chain amino acid transport system ATP-binding protein